MATDSAGSDRKDTSAPQMLASAVALLALIGGVLINQLSFESLRPASKERTIRESLPIQSVPARLWQDPFSALTEAGIARERRADAKMQTATDGGSIVEYGSVREATEKYLAKVGASGSGQFNVTVMAVMAFSGSYAEYVESRRRLRYAVVSGLLESEFAPYDAEHVGVIRLERQLGLDQTLVPYEWFECAETGRENPPKCEPGSRVLVLWLREEAFGKLASLSALWREPSAMGHPNLAGGKPRLAVVGPAGSSTLLGWTSELCRGNVADTSGAVLAGTRIFSPGATVADERIVLNASDAASTSAACREAATRPAPGPARQTAGDAGGEQATGTAPAAASPAEAYRPEGSPLSRVFAESGIQFMRTIGSDDLLVDLLAREILLRSFSPACLFDASPACLDNSLVLTIAESDTLYSRSLSESLFLETFRIRCPPGTKDRESCRRRIWKTFPSEPIYYLRGLDGESARAGQTATGPDSEKNREDKGAPGGAATKEYPAGNVQFDYLRRLAKSARQVETDERRDAPAKVVRAIAIFGSDAYDKLLIMQALRPEFPNAVFYTTDLDARLLQKERFSWTRNLVVASHFGLELSWHVQEHFGPFRDAYQPPQFLATRLAADQRCTSSAVRVLPPLLTQPRLYEVTREGASPLATRRSAADQLGAEVRAGAYLEQALRDAIPAVPVATSVPGAAPVAAPQGNAHCRVLYRYSNSLPVQSLHAAEVSAGNAWIAVASWIAGAGALFVFLLSSRSARIASGGLRAVCPYWPEAGVAAGVVGWLFFDLAGDPLPSAPMVAVWLFATAACCIAVHPGRGHRAALLWFVTGAALALLPAWYGLVTWRTLGWLSLGSAYAMLVCHRATAVPPEGAAPRQTAGRCVASHLGRLALAVFVGCLCMVAWRAATGDLEERWGFLDGASTWPSELLRAAGIALGIWAAYQVTCGNRDSLVQLEQRFFGDGYHRRLNRLQRLVTGRSRLLRLFGMWCKRAPAYRSRTRDESPRYAAVLWARDRVIMDERFMLARAICGVVFLWSGFMALMLLAPPVPPVRGPWSTLLDVSLIMLSSFLLMFLIVGVMDRLWMRARLIRALASGTIVWRKDAVARIEGPAAVPLHGRGLAEARLSVDLIASATAAEARHIYLPFVMLLFVVLARNEAFDNWPWTASMLGMFGICFLLLILAAIRLRTCAEHARRHFLDRLHSARTTLVLESAPERDRLYVDAVIADVQRKAEGAFRPFPQDWLRGVAIPSGGFGALELFRYFQ